MATTIVTTHTEVLAQTERKKALLVIDVQENLLKPESKWHMDTAAIPSFLNSLNRAIQFFEENHLPVLYTQNEWTNPILNMISGNICKKGHKGVGIDKRVHRLNDTVYKKSRNSAFSNKDLDAWLRKYSVTELYVAGLFAEACIKGTAKAAIKKNYNVYVLADAIGARSNGKKIRAINYCKNIGSTIIGTDQLEDSIAWRY